MKNKRTSQTIHSLFTKNLDVRKGETVLVFTDRSRPFLEKLVSEIAHIGKGYTPAVTTCTFAPTGCHGVEPPEQLWEKAFGAQAFRSLKQEKLLSSLISKKAGAAQLKRTEQIIGKYREGAVKVVIALSHFSTSHTKFRDLLTGICGTRYASMPLFEESMLLGPMMVDWRAMHQRAGTIARRVNRSRKVIVECDNGTEMEMITEGREAMIDSGIIRKAGQFSNLPAGEVFLAPVEGSAEGIMVLEWAPTRKLSSPLTITVEQGLVQRIEGKERYRAYLREKCADTIENRNIAELGIGMNDRAHRADNILESEKILGTVHIALGDNSSFGGKVRTSFHQDFVFFQPTVTLLYQSGRRRKLMERGKLV
jgi:leucyl aminopeptidase (aminopeptidase T)